MTMGKGSGSGGRGSRSEGLYLRGGHAPPKIRGGYNSSYTTTIRPKTDRNGATITTQRPSSSSATSSTSRGKGSRSRAATYGKPKGLLNVGNTCYANSALQCLLSTALTHALIDPKASAIFRRYSSNPNLLEKGSGSVDSNEAQTPASAADNKNNEESKRVRRERRRRDRDDRRMRENCTWLTRELKSIALEYQHPEHSMRSSNRTSSSSASSFMPGWLSTAAEPTVVVDPGSITKHPERLSKCLVPYQQEDAHEFLRALLSTLVMNGQNKQLSSLFDGLLESAVTCLHCRRPSLTRDRYMDLSLDICGSHVETLTDALAEFTKTETLSGDNKVFCQKCDTKRPATKGLRLATAPSILVCHLKRFAFDSYGRLVRLAKRIHFPLRLEIGDYMSRVNKARPPPYELVAVLVHQGQSCDSGHYLAYVKNAGKWYKCNDSLIEPVEVSKVLKQQAYILLYEVEDMRSKNGYAPAGHRHVKPSSMYCRSDSDWAPYLNGWREYLLSTSLCGMDDSLLGEFCWDVSSNKKVSRRRDGSVSGTSSGSGRNSSNTSRRRRRGRDMSNRSIDSCSHQDAHDDLSTLGESTVESADTSNVPFRRISSSGNLNALERYRHHQYHQYAGPHHSHSTGRPRQHFFTNSTSDPDNLPDYYRPSNRPPWPACSDTTDHHVDGGTVTIVEPTHPNTTTAASGCRGTTTAASSSRLRKELPPRPESGHTAGAGKETAAGRQQQHIPPLPPMNQHRRSSSAPGSDPASSSSGGEQQPHVYYTI